MRTAPLQLRCQAERQHHVGSRVDRDMQVGLLGDLDPLRIDYHQLRVLLTLGRIDRPHQVQVGDGDVVAPDHDQVGMLQLFRRHAGCGAEHAGIGRAADDPAKLTPRQEGCAELVKEAPVHGATSQLAMRPCIVERQHRLRAMLLYSLGEAGVDQIQCLVPGDRLELTSAARAGPFQRAGQTVRAVHEFGVVAGDLVADHAGCVGVC